MLVPLFVAAVAAIPAVAAQTVTGAVTVCETQVGVFPFTGTGALPVHTTTLASVSTNVFQITTTTRETITVTPSATVFTDIETVTTTSTTTVTSIPPASIIPAPANWFPIYNPELAAPTPMARVKRGSISARAEHDIELRKRQTLEGNTAGYIQYENGTSGNLNQTYPYFVLCTVQLFTNITEVTVVTAAPDVVTLVPSTATAEVTTTVTVVDTVIQVQPTPTIRAACMSNNVVNHIRDIYNKNLYFDRVIWHANGGLPVANALVIPASSGTECCELCHSTASCAGSFFVPLEKKCHLRLNQPAPVASSLPSGISPPYPISTGTGNSTSNNTIIFPTASGAALRRRQATGTGVSIVMATGISELEGTMSIMAPIMAPLSTAVPVPETCPLGSMTTFLGTAYGSESFSKEKAIVFSNGPCGRLVPWMIPVEDFNTNDPTRPGRQFKRI